MLALAGLDREAASNAASSLNELIEPAADAVSIFEDGASFRVDAYYGDETRARAALDLFSETYDDVAAIARLIPVVEENWVALSQAALPPVHAGRFTICGSHDVDRVPRGPHTIVVDAGEAFGTAHHATTSGCLIALDRLARSSSYHNVLDLGTGSGVLALAAARILPRARVLASDVDARAVEVASENAERNGFGQRSARGPTFVVADGVSDPQIGRRKPFDLVVANILAAPLIVMAPDIIRCLSERGTLVLSGILVPQAREVCARYRSLGVELRRHERHNGWSTLVFQRRCDLQRRPATPNLYMPDYD